MFPQMMISLTDEQREQLDKLVDKLEDDDDVSEVFTSAEM
ncbi:transcriptional regulatory protein YebC [bioreactor metagenome]|uniref:Transcriptional regulatory protein YebC n=2 Tax=root TaxID=1 RepID=A0A645IRI2_9ZZZZ